MSGKLIELRRPEGGAEVETLYRTYHRCGPSRALIRTEVGRPDMDELIFPTGPVGYSMPVDVPFAVTALDPCGACGRLLTAWFVWRRGYASHAGELLIPGDHS